MNGDSIFFENHTLSREIELNFSSRIFGSAPILPHISSIGAEVNLHDGFLKKFFRFFLGENFDIVLYELRIF